VTPARAAGLLYLLVAITGAFGTFYVPLALVVPGDAAATADRIRSSEALVRLGIASELVSATLFIFLALALYRLFKAVDRQSASLMVILVVVSVPISFVGVACELGALGLLSGASYLSVFGAPQLEALAYVFLRLHTHAIVVAEIFWGLWLFPLALLAIRSGVVPRAVGVLLIVAGSAYLVVTLTAVLLPAFASLVSAVATLPEAGELSMIVWLLTTRTGAPSRAPAEIAGPA
jgi:hypothetical protein